VLRSTELKLQQKSRNVSRQPQMLHHTRKYYNTQGHYMHKLVPHEANKNNEVKVQEINLYNKNNRNKSLSKNKPKERGQKVFKKSVIGKNNLRSLQDQHSYAGSSNKLDFYPQKPGKTTNGSRYRFYKWFLLILNYRGSSTASDAISSSNENKVMYVLKAQKIAQNSKNKQKSNKVKLYLVEKKDRNSR
jgi:hypothetical protein